MMRAVLTILILTLTFTGVSQGYTSFLTGDSANVNVTPERGTLLAGGAGDNDDAMTWFLERANGGDVVVIRASGSDGYNNYLFSSLGVEVNSVETIVWNDSSASTDEYVLGQLANAEAIWIAGGDQWDYVSYWKDNAVEDVLNMHIAEKGLIGGTSAGMAILGGSYFNAMNGTVYSDESLEDPYNNWLHLGHGDFLETPFLSNVITDTHYDDPDRRGRHVTFLARMFQDEGIYPLGIACDEYSAVCVDENGIAHCFGEYPDYDDFIYFIRPNCEEPWGPEVCVENELLHWYRDMAALKVYRVSATINGSKFLDLNDWLTGEGGEWQTWYVENGLLNFVEDGNAPSCAAATLIDEGELPSLTIYPNPTRSFIVIDSPTDQLARLLNVQGGVINEWQLRSGTNTFSVQDLAPGVYVIQGEETVSRFQVH
ncbi:MAG: type 1 glutamine amidotransferase-like domain-containing protein [Flavobacteriales bacterium]|nr:type 1 glutamine amidotransferase-like domain-containing protein [Flavobacteriales bacterium]